jgi:hypothetical protein
MNYDTQIEEVNITEELAISAYSAVYHKPLVAHHCGSEVASGRRLVLSLHLPELLRSQVQ